MDVRTESNFSSDAEERGARHEARAAVQMAQDLRQRVEQGELQTQENFQQLQAALSQSQQLQTALQQQQWLMGQQLGAMAADFQNFTARFDRFEKRKAASAMRPQKRERDAARHAAAAAAAASSSESFEPPPRTTRGALANLAHQQRAQAAGEQNATLTEQLAAAQQGGAAAEAKAADTLSRAAAAEARAADAVTRAAAAEARAAAAEEEARRSKEAQRAAEAAAQQVGTAAEARAADVVARAAASEEEAQRAQRAAERRAVAAEALALAAQARQSAAEEEAAAAKGKVQEAEASSAAAVAAERELLARAEAAEARAVAAEQAAANQEAVATSARKQLQGVQQAAAALSTEKAAAELRATTAEARATAAETATAEALAEVQRVREDEARQQAECESLRAALQGIREAGGCPISRGLPRDPVVASDGQTYDRRSILPWLRDHGTSPLTREPLQPQLHPNRFAAAVLRQLGEIGLGSTDDGEDAESSAQSQNPQDAADPEPDALINAIRRRDEAAALALLQRPGPLPGLNDLYDGAPVLLDALNVWRGHPPLQLVLAILARRDFSLVNWKGGSGATFLHIAALLGCLPMCQAILAREDFTEVLAMATTERELASEAAQRHGHVEVAAFLENAEAQARRAQRA